MKPASFAYARPESIEAAVALLADGATPLAGGQSLVPLMNLRLARPGVLVDLAALSELARIEETNDGVRIGSMVRHETVESDPTVARVEPALGTMAPWIAHPPIRRRGTIGGAVAHADPAGEWPLAVTVLDLVVELAGPSGRRRVTGVDFFTGPFETARNDDELIVGFSVGARARPDAFGFSEIARRVGDYATAMALATASVDPAGRLDAVAIGLGAVGPTPLRLTELEEALTGVPLDRVDLDQVADAAAEVARPTGDVHGSASYRRAMAGEAARRAVSDTVDRLRKAAAPSPSPPRAAPRAPRRPTPGRAGSVPSTGVEVAVHINGIEQRETVPARLLLSDHLRDGLGLTGTHVGCEHGVCGACTILLDGIPTRSCLVFTAQVDGSSVTTIEAIASRTGDLHPVQAAFVEHHGLQCGYCTPAMVLSTIALLDDPAVSGPAVSDPALSDPALSEPEIRDALSGNLCRCTGYVKIVDAVMAAAAASP